MVRDLGLDFDLLRVETNATDRLNKDRLIREID